MTAFLIVTFFVLIAGTTTMSFYSSVIPLLVNMTKVFIGVTVVEGAIMALFVGIAVRNNIVKSKKHNDE